MRDEAAPFSRESLRTLALLILTAAGLAVCGILAAPFLAPLTWALAASVAAQPLHRWIESRIGRPNLAAALSTGLVTVLLLLPTVLVAQQIGQQAVKGGQQIRESIRSGELESQLQANPKSAQVYRLMEENFDLNQAAEQLVEIARTRIGNWVQGTFWLAGQILITIFLLYYLFRDRHLALQSFHWLVPLSKPEANKVLQRVRSMIRATVYGTLTVAAIQGALGGVMFWVLGLPAPLLWGSVMGLLSIIPVLGAFIVWFPAAAALAMQGEWGRAAVLVVWGLAVIGLIDNLLYPMLVGKEIRLHTVPVFLAIAGGLIVFGVAGLVLGPVALVITLALIEVIKQRMNGHGSAEQAA